MATKTIPLPPGMTTRDFAGALDELRQIVGKEWVFTHSDEAFSSYRDPYFLEDEKLHVPSAAIAPSNTEEMQKILRIANQYGLPLWPVSGGRNFAYGGPVPRAPGTMVLDLKRMNRILEVNEDAAYALVEPGVTYFELHKYLQDNNIKLWVDPPAPGWGSILGNTADRGVGYSPYGDHFFMQCGMEVMLADGMLVRTGMGAIPDSKSWQLFKYGFGPYLDGIFTQSNYGIITKLGIWLMPEPPGYRPFLVTFPHEDDLAQVVEIMRPLKVQGIIQNAASLGNILLEAAVVSSKSQFYQGKGPVPLNIQHKIAKELDVGMWNLYAALYGPEPMMDMNWQVIQGAFSQIKGAKFYLAEDRKGDLSFEYRAKLMKGEPNLTCFNFLNWIGSGGAHTDFAPITPISGEEALKQYHMVRNHAHEYGFDYISEFIAGWRELHHVFALQFDVSDPDSRRRALELFRLLIKESAADGFGDYRTHISAMDDVAKSYSFNDGAILKLQERIKDALDPNGILAPGKSGIWPKNIRDTKRS